MNAAGSSTHGPGAGRYAPSPTGELHLGNLRTALLAWLFARATGRAFRLRIDDLDAARVRPGVAVRQAADLAALGLAFDGPVVLASELAPQHSEALARLAGWTYECFCTRREIAEAAEAPHGLPRRYPGTCRDLSEVQRSRLRRTRSPALRVRADSAVQSVADLLHGSVSGQVDDFVVRRNDGVAAYMVTVVVDDAAMGVDQVIRADDLLAATPFQAWLAVRLGLPTPTYGHVPLVVNAAGQRLAKRDGAVTISDLAAVGTGPAQVLGLLACSLDLAQPGEPVTPALLLDRFDPTRVPARPWTAVPYHAAGAMPSG
ncbi:MAG TPA: tRNA glutamyl-Q(34) synthetase GluQRS [Propionibacteriaceae bacterium]|nr:tRNA glutamyl-Q(34) synthetase GluQRS [Propionibacteriaceae bacterium]